MMNLSRDAMEKSLRLNCSFQELAYLKEIKNPIRRLIQLKLALANPFLIT